MLNYIGINLTQSISSGLTVLATCSSHNFPLVKSRGAHHVFDYNDPNAIADIKAATSNKLSLIFDCVGEGATPGFCYEAMGTSGGKYSSLLFPVDGPRKDIAVSMVFAYTAYGEAFTKFGFDTPAKREDYVYASEFFGLCEGLLDEGKLVPHPSGKRADGLEGVPEGLKELREGRVSGEKLVYEV